MSLMPPYCAQCLLKRMLLPFAVILQVAVVARGLKHSLHSLENCSFTDNSFAQLLGPLPLINAEGVTGTAMVISPSKEAVSKSWAPDIFREAFNKVWTPVLKSVEVKQKIYNACTGLAVRAEQKQVHKIDALLL